MADLKETPKTLPFAVQQASGPQQNGGTANDPEEEDTRSAVMEINGMRIYEAVEHRAILYADQLIDIETFLEFSFQTGRDLELINGIMMERATARGATVYTPLNGATKLEGTTKEEIEGKPQHMAAQLTHEKLFAWLITIMNLYARRRGLGLVLGSRTTVNLDGYSGRLPDLLFVRQERMNIVQERNISGPPDLVVELVSPNDRPGMLRDLQADYCALGVAEIVFVNMPSQHVRVVRLEETEYVEETFVTGEWRCRSLPGLNLQVEWLLQEPRPDELDTLQSLLDNAAAGS